MSWEEPAPQRSRWPRLAMAGAGVIVAVVLSVVFIPRGGDRSTLAVGPTAPSVDRGLEDFDASDFVPDRLPPLSTASREPGDGPLLRDADFTIVAADDTGLQLVDVATGSRRRVQVVRAAPASLGETVFAVGDSIVIDADADVVRIRDGDVRPVRIARSHRAIPTLDDRSVWVFDNFSPFVEGIASRVDFEGDVRDQIPLPAVAQPLVGTASGLVVGAPGAISYITTDGDERLVANGTAVAADGERIAWMQCAGDMACAIVVGTMDDPDRVRTTLDPDSLPAGFFGIRVGAFSPDGRWLAVPLYRTRGRRAIERVSVTVLDATTGTEVFREEGSSLTPLDQPLAWSPDSRWLVFVSGSDVRAWRAGTGRSTAIDAELRGVRALAVR